MTATRNRVTCPICNQQIRQAANRPIMLPHTSAGRLCPYSGQAISTADTPQDNGEDITA